MLESKFTKVAMCAAGGAVAAMTATGAAMANDTTPVPAPVPAKQSISAEQTPLVADARTYWGKVIARSGLKVRSGPSQSYRQIGFLKYGQTVKIECKVNGQWINGNPRWYKLKDGRWAWASARYIANIGAAPHWCKFR
ncbi:SH3 domain-containing protein [Streptomyces sp. N2-109]|uniref:SH3 domain-containing protein n=1 Tax=Streptomyces gossypii TaxID=2883101 RepID=A0ABT2JV95_9ACTN|nr:SH3 domain-containing protein [Streptomyces gossypii]MCT2591785.1 SH3 domain-containing protein [Streptomyces gossypii]